MLGPGTHPINEEGDAMADTPRDRPVLALTPGDPAGIGPELVIAALRDEGVRAAARLLVVGDGALLEARARRIGVEFAIERVSSAVAFRDSAADAACLASAEGGGDEGVLGRVDAEAGRASVAWIRRAAALALEGAVDAVVTAPINKQSIKRGGCKHEGHTELLGEVTRAKPVMMLMGGSLRVAIVTRHVALRDVPRILNRAEIVRTVRTVDEALRRDFALASPRIAVLALNPHASDDGRFGDEEKTLVGPAVRELVAAGVNADGPLVPDVAFWHVLRGSHDAVVAMYHDQGLIPLKTLFFETGINVTLGLPIVRTSPDHGTAFEIAGRGTADTRSFFAATRAAVEIVVNRRKAPR
jgi:4-hydroxythreonine-4-phosphate dehydrogenase